MKQKTQLIKIDAPELNGVEKSKADEIRKVFEPMADMLQGFEQAYDELIMLSKDGINKELTAKAKRLRLDIGRVRIETGKLKDKKKEMIKLEDRAIMGVHNILVWAVKEKEDKLKEIEDYFDIQEQKRLQKIQSERVEELSKYIDDAHERVLSDMPDDVWDAYISSKKKEYEDRVEAEKRAEAEKIAREKAELEERERIRKENEALKKEAEERAKNEAERVERENAEKRQREAEYEAKINYERKEKEKIEKELRAKKDAEEAELRRQEHEKIKRENSSDKEKLQIFINDLNIDFPLCNSKQSKKVSKDIQEKFQSFKIWAQNQINQL